MDVSSIAIKVDSRQIRQSKTELVGMQAAGMSAQKSMVALGAAVVGLGAATIGLSAGVRVLADFDTSLRGLQAVSGATANQMKSLEEQSRSLGSTTAFSAAEAADAQRFLAMAGLEVNEVLGATPGILELAVAGQIDLARAADLASNVLGGFRLEVDDLNRVNNVLAATASKSNTSVEQLGSALSFAAPIAAAAGISIEETAAAIGSLGDAGLQGTRAGTGFLGIIRQLSLITPKAEEALSKYGIATDQVDVETRGLTAVLDTLRDANLSAADAIQIFGSEAGPAGQILANSADRVREFTTELENSEGAISSMAEIMGQGLTMSFKEFQSAAQEVVLVIGRDLGAGGELEGAVRSTTDVVRALGENMDTVADVATGLAIIVGGRLAASATTSAVAFASMAASGSSAAIGLRMMATTSPLAAAGLTSVAVAGRAASVALAFFGGPIGLAITGVAGAVYLLSERQTLAEEAADKHKEAIGELDRVMGNANKTAKTAEQQAKATAKARLEDAKAANEQALSIVQSQMAQLREQRGLLERSSPGSPLIASINEQLTDMSFELVAAKERVEDLEDALVEANKPAISLLDAYRQFANSHLDIDTGSTSDDLGGVSDKIQDVIDALEFERQQLGRTDREQAAYNALKQAGIKASNDNAFSVRSAAYALYDLEQQLKATEQAQKDFNDGLLNEEAGWKSIDQMVESLQRERQQVGMLASEIEKLEAVRRAENIAKEAGIPLTDEMRQKIEDEIDATNRLIAENQEYEDTLNYLESVGARAFDRIGSEMTSMAMQGQTAFQTLQNVGQAVLSELIQSFVELAAVNPLKNSLFGGSNQTLGSVGGVFGDIFGDLFGGGRASGGPVSAGTMYEVNERGPELLNVGNRQYLMTGSQSGSVTPNSAIGGGAANVNVSVINNGQPMQVTGKSQSTGGDGSVNLEVMVDDMMASNLKSRSSKSNKAVRRGFGVDQPLAIR